MTQIRPEHLRRARHCAPLLAIALLVGSGPSRAATREPGGATRELEAGASPAATATDRLAAQRTMARLGAGLAAAPGDLELGNSYRMAARRAGALEAAIAHLDSLRAMHPAEPALGVHLALAHIDRLGRPGLDLAASAVTVSRAVRLLDQVLRDAPGHWAALYARGLCKLLWPSKTRRARDATVDLERCLHNLEASREALATWPVHLLLGDAEVKQRRYALARQHYEWVLAATGRRPELTARLDLNGAALLDHVESLHSLTQPVDTDLAPFWTATAPGEP